MRDYELATREVDEVDGRGKSRWLVTASGGMSGRMGKLVLLDSLVLRLGTEVALHP